MMNTAEQYRAEWSAKTGRAPSDIYIPEALREVDLEREAELRDGPLKRGDIIRILTDGLESSATRVGDVLTVVEAESGGFFYTDTPGLMNVPSRWTFPTSSEGTGWERVR
jgi:hypothetical protein